MRLRIDFAEEPTWESVDLQFDERVAGRFYIGDVNPDERSAYSVTDPQLPGEMPKVWIYGKRAEVFSGFAIEDEGTYLGCITVEGGKLGLHPVSETVFEKNKPYRGREK